MPSSTEQVAIQTLIDNASKHQLASMRTEAEDVLAEANVIMTLKMLSKDERMSIDLAIEILTRLDAKIHNGGWWYRAKRRPQLFKMYLGG
jgi:hypothetical protein